MRTLFITGTDTDAGKTLFASALVARLVADNKRVAVFKPLAAGAAFSSGVGQVVNDDALALLEYSNVGQSYHQVNPYCFEPAIAPHIAAEEQGIKIDTLQLCDGVKEISENNTDVLVVEGAGGWLVPINHQESLADFAESIQADVILVVGMKLGCINHAMLTVAQIEHSGLSLTGWVANTTGKQMSRYTANLEYLKSHIPAPLLAEIPYLPEIANSASVVNNSALLQAGKNIDLKSLNLET